MSAILRFFRNKLKSKTTKNEGKEEKMTKEENKSNSETGLINRVLPPEVLEKIFSHLSLRDLIKVMFVCKESPIKKCTTPI